MANKENIYTDTAKRIFYIGDVIDSVSMSKICFDLLSILDDDQEKEEKEIGYKRKPIKIFINSFGGRVADMWSLVDIMLNSKTPIHTYCTGYAYSCGFYIFIAGSKRYITNHVDILYHQLSSSNWGT